MELDRVACLNRELIELDSMSEDLGSSRHPPLDMDH